jgi:hypothetical protein
MSVVAHPDAGDQLDVILGRLAEFVHWTTADGDNPRRVSAGLIHLHILAGGGAAAARRLGVATYASGGIVATAGWAEEMRCRCRNELGRC